MEININIMMLSCKQFENLIEANVSDIKYAEGYLLKSSEVMKVNFNVEQSRNVK